MINLRLRTGLSQTMVWMSEQEGKSFFCLVGTPSAEPSLKHWLVARDLSSQLAEAAFLSAVGVSIAMTTMQSVSLLEDCYFRLLGGAGRDHCASPHTGRRLGLGL